MRGLALILAGLAAAGSLQAQRELAGVARARLALEKLNVLGTVLMIAAHPDDENTALLAYFARGRHYRTAYLSLTRGEGGQNLIGPEQGELLGVLRTQELLAARRIDGAEQYFTRAVDFGYSKTAGETLAKWGREEILGDIVWLIRRLRPDIVILRFSGTARDGHGHHQASAILGKEAFEAAGDPRRFPEQLARVAPWQPRRLFWNVFSFRGGRFSDAGDMPERIDLDPGSYSPLLGFSFAEIAGKSRSQHRSQGFGAPETRGSVRNSLVLLAGEPAREDPFEGIDTSWNRIEGGVEVGRLLLEAARRYDPERPQETFSLLVRARPILARLKDPWAPVKLGELDETVGLLAGLWLEAAADRDRLVPGGQLKIDAVAINRSELPLKLLGVEIDGVGRIPEAAPLAYNQPVRRSLVWKVPADTALTQPFWLREPRKGARYEISDPEWIGAADEPPALNARFRLRVGPEELVLARPVLYRYVDRVRGELTRPPAVVPPVAVRLAREAVVAPVGASRTVPVELLAHAADVSGEVWLEVPAGWRVNPLRRTFQLELAGDKELVGFELTAPRVPSGGIIQAKARVGEREITQGTVVIDYPHIPPQTLAPPARAPLVGVEVTTLARRVGYVMGAGDTLPEAIEQLGCQVTLLEARDLAAADLSVYDAIVTGVRAYNVRPDLRAHQQRLLAYVEAGGTLIVQYNVLERPAGDGRDPLARLGPYPLKIGRGRVSVEEAEMRPVQGDHPLLQSPNRLTARDFEGWVQERGLYFAEQWDERYQPLWAVADPGEEPQLGGTLVARYGKGVYIYTALAWFRQLPAGVPGAYRIFANLLSAGKVLP